MAVRRNINDYLEKVSTPIDKQTLTGSNLYHFNKYKIWWSETEAPGRYLENGSIWRRTLTSNNPDIWQIRNEENAGWVNMRATSEQDGLLAAEDYSMIHILDNDVIKKSVTNQQETFDVRFKNKVSVMPQGYTAFDANETIVQSPALSSEFGGWEYLNPNDTTSCKSVIEFSKFTLGDPGYGLEGTLGSIVWESAIDKSHVGVMHLSPSHGQIDQGDYVSVCVNNSGSGTFTDFFREGVRMYSYSGNIWARGSLEIGGNITLGEGIDSANYSISTSGEIECLSVNTLSSIKEKHVIGNSELDAVSFLNNIDVIDFIYKNDIEKTQRIGFIAENTDPLVSGVNQNQMDHGNLLGVLIKANQELAARIKVLEEK